jgi:hypothetical protein
MDKLPDGKSEPNYKATLIPLIASHAGECMIFFMLEWATQEKG